MGQQRTGLPFVWHCIKKSQYLNLFWSTNSNIRFAFPKYVPDIHIFLQVKSGDTEVEESDVKR